MWAGFISPTLEFRAVNTVVVYSFKTVRSVIDVDVHGECVMTKYPFHFMVSAIVLALLAGCSSTPHYTQQGWYSSTATSQAKVNQLQQREAVYFVNSGDTLSAIARNFAVSALQIQYRNEITDPHSL